MLLFSICWVESMRVAHSLFAALGRGICLFIRRDSFMRTIYAGAWTTRLSRIRIARLSLPKYCRDVFFSRRANASPKPTKDIRGHPRKPMSIPAADRREHAGTLFAKPEI